MDCWEANVLLQPLEVTGCLIFNCLNHKIQSTIIKRINKKIANEYILVWWVQPLRKYMWPDLSKDALLAQFYFSPPFSGYKS